MFSCAKLRMAVAVAGLALVVAVLPADARAGKLSPPVIHEVFTPLPCSGKTGARDTLQEEGCAEQRILRSDASINVLAKSIFSLLMNDAARARFIAAQRAWLSFRHADCLSRSDLFQGGTLAAVIDAECTAERNLQRIKELRVMQSDFRRNG